MVVLPKKTSAPDCCASFSKAYILASMFHLPFNVLAEVGQLMLLWISSVNRELRRAKPAQYLPYQYAQTPPRVPVPPRPGLSSSTTVFAPSRAAELPQVAPLVPPPTTRTSVSR